MKEHLTSRVSWDCVNFYPAGPNWLIQGQIFVCLHFKVYNLLMNCGNNLSSYMKDLAKQFAKYVFWSWNFWTYTKLYIYFTANAWGWRESRGSNNTEHGHSMERDEGNKGEEGKSNAEKVLWVAVENKLDLHLECKIEFFKCWQSFSLWCPEVWYPRRWRQGRDLCLFWLQLFHTLIME